MPLADPYSPCPCGSGQKYKWCCLRSEPYLERALRLEEGGQYEMALKPLDEGLAKAPDSPVLAIRKVALLAQLDREEAARGVIEDLLKRRPKHREAIGIHVRLLIDLEGPKAAAERFQAGWAQASEEDRIELAETAYVLGLMFSRIGNLPAAGRHLELASHGGEPVASESARQWARIAASLQTPSVRKNHYQLAPAPETAAADFRESFEKAMAWSREGLWGAAAAAFELLSGDPKHGALADRNQGLCRLWFDDEAAALDALRRYIGRTPPCDDALEIEALCQDFDVTPAVERLDELQLSWPLRDRHRLIEALGGDPTVAKADPRLVDDEADSAAADAYLLLDRRPPVGAPGISRDQIPLVEAVLLITPDALILEVIDDGRLDRLTDRVVALAGRAIPPAHPRTKIVDRKPRHEVALYRQPFMPEGTPVADRKRLRRELTAYLFEDVWPDVANGHLDWRTPIEAAAIPELRPALQALLFRFRSQNLDWVGMLDWEALCRRLKIEPERAADPQTLDLETLHLSRFVYVPVDALDDDRLIDFYHRTVRYGLRWARNAAAARIADRPNVMARSEINPQRIIATLVIETAESGDRAGADEWLRRGRESVSPRDGFAWDLVELQMRMGIENAEIWVPFLAVLLERGRRDANVNSRLLTLLIQTGLVKVAPDPNNPEEAVLDTRVLEAYLGRYGPRIEAAGRDERVWTPDQEAPAAGGIWTPGSTAATAERPRLIIPGQ